MSTTSNKPMAAEKISSTKQQSTAQTTTKGGLSSSPLVQSRTTRITAHCNTGFGNTLFLRGEGAGLSWDQGIPMRNINDNTWIWETDRPFNSCSFKVLINDKQYEMGNNRIVNYHDHCEYSPTF